MTALRALPALLLTACPMQAIIGVAPAADGGVALPDFAWPRDPIDVLFVVDNSGSMVEEQERLAQDFATVDEGASLCNAANFAKIREYVKLHPGLSPAQWEEPYPDVLRACGFVELLQFFELDFHIGVITTDLNDCDSPIGDTLRGSVPQRGCLQTGSVGIERAVIDPLAAEPGAVFAELVRGVGFWGSAWEQGLDAALALLDPTVTAESPHACATTRDCSGDRGRLLRERVALGDGTQVEPRLLLVIVSDEDDCSNRGRIDETVPGSAEDCYDRPELLEPAATLIDELGALRSQPELVSVAVLGGVALDPAAAPIAGCMERARRVTYVCTPSHGNSVATCDMCVNGQPVCACHPAIPAGACQGAEQASTRCCQADWPGRYLQVSATLARGSRASLCGASYTADLSRMLRVALDLGF